MGFHEETLLSINDSHEETLMSINDSHEETQLSINDSELSESDRNDSNPHSSMLPIQNTLPYQWIRHLSLPRLQDTFHTNESGI